MAGELWTWGDQYKGQLGLLKDGWGHDLKENIAQPTKVVAIPKV
jgi:hypothetical protein